MDTKNFPPQVPLPGFVPSTVPILGPVPTRLRYRRLQRLRTVGALGGAVALAAGAGGSKPALARRRARSYT